MIALRSYEFLADAWRGGVTDWCKAASRHVLSGGRAWLVTISDGQANWIKRRLLREGISLFGLQFFNAASLRRETCLRRGVDPARNGKETLRFLLRLQALDLVSLHPEAANAARHPGACLSALEDLASAGWLEGDIDARHVILPPVLEPWLGELRRDGQWTPEIDHLLSSSSSVAEASPPLVLCVFGWEASFWPSFRLLTAALREARDSLVYAPLPRGSSEGIQMEWQTALEEFCGEAFEPCESVDFTPSHASMIGRLEGTDLSTGESDPPEPELLVGHQVEDTVVLVRDFISRWLNANPRPASSANSDHDDRFVILSPRRDLAAISLLRCLAEAGLEVEDELGETPEPTLSVQIQRAILAYHLGSADLEDLMIVVELLNDYLAKQDDRDGESVCRVFPLDPVEVRRLLHSAFGEVQHHSARVLRDTFARSRSETGVRLCQLLDHLGEWPESVSWPDALERWKLCLDGLCLSTDSLEPLWSQWTKLVVRLPVPASAFFQFLAGVLGCAPARRSPDGMHRYARVVMTTLDGAIGQSWGGALFLDSNEGAWPLYPDEDGFLDDAARTRLNRRREEGKEAHDSPWHGYLLTSSDRAQLEHFRFMEILGNCTGPVAFAGQSRDAVEPGKELYANEWALRCLLEGGKPIAEGEKLLDRWHNAISRTRVLLPPLPKAEREHLYAVFSQRRDPSAGFGEYGFNFESLSGADELPWTEAWSARDLETAWNQPATFALKQIFGVSSTHARGRDLIRGEGWMVGRLVHHWMHVALSAADEPRQMARQDWSRALMEGLPAARRETEKTLSSVLTKVPAFGAAAEQTLPWWWRSTLQKSEWAARRCLEAMTVIAEGIEGDVWLGQNRRFHSDLTTKAGTLRLQARCDVVLAGQSSLNGASCQLIDIRTGAAPSPGSHSAGNLEKGQGIDLAALVFLALKEGALPERTRIGVVHPDAVNLSLLSAESQDAASPAMERLASQQRSLNFGQGGKASSPGRSRDGESLPLATVPIDPGVLASKRQQ